MATEKIKSFVQEFVDFIKKFGVIGLSLGVVIGGAVKTLTDSLTANILSPILGKIAGKADLKDLVIWDMKIGLFINDIINFAILMFVVYLAVKLFINKLLSEEERKSLNIN